MEQVTESKQIVEFNEFETKLQAFKGKYVDVVYDLTDPEQDTQARSDRLSIGKVISSLDSKHKELKAPLKAKTDLIDGERKRIKDDLLSVQEGIKNQIKDHEAQIQAHADLLQGKVDAITNHAVFDGAELTSGEILDLIESLTSIEVDDSYEHRKADATLAKIDATKLLETALEARVKHESEQAELEQLRKDAAATAQKEREEKIAKDAAEAATKAAEKRITDAEESAKEADARAETQANEAAAQVEAAAQRERDIAAAKIRDEAAEAERRERNTQHKGRINRAAVDAIMLAMSGADAGNAENARKVAKSIVIAIAKKQIPAVSISY